MNKFFYILIVLGLAYSCNNGPSQSSSNQNPTIHVDNIPLGRAQLPSISDCGYEVKKDYGEGWSLVFKENFDAGYDDQWIAWESGAYNQELQHYQPSNVIVDNGFLYLKGKREKVSGKTQPNNQKVKKFNFTSGRVESKKLFGPKNIEGQKKMKFSARLRLVEGEGLCPCAMAAEFITFLKRLGRP